MFVVSSCLHDLHVGNLPAYCQSFMLGHVNFQNFNIKFMVPAMCLILSLARLALLIAQSLGKQLNANTSSKMLLAGIWTASGKMSFSNFCTAPQTTKCCLLAVCSGLGPTFPAGLEPKPSKLHTALVPCWVWFFSDSRHICALKLAKICAKSSHNCALKLAKICPTLLLPALCTDSGCRLIARQRSERVASQ